MKILLEKCAIIGNNKIYITLFDIVFPISLI